MGLHHWIQILLYIGAILVITPLLGKYMAAVFTGKRCGLEPALGWVEKASYRAGGIDPSREMRWTEYAGALLWFNLFGFLAVFFLQLLQEYLPLNPQKFPAVPWHTSFNTAISFVTNTNWQSYAGETTLSYLTQMTGLAVQNFLSAATGLAVLLALIRGISGHTISTLGNFWVDVVRSIVYLFLPLSIILAVFLINEGIVQSLSPYFQAETLENGTQSIPLGPVASQIAIKQLGTNGGGFFNANSAHPFENPTPFSNWLEMISIIAIPAALTYTYGTMTGEKKHSWILFGVMILMWIGGLALSMYSEFLHDPVLEAYPLLEGKETRLGITNSLLWSTITTSTANGSVNAMISSMTPFAGGIALLNIMLGELIFGGVGVGLCSILMFVILTVFLSGLMVGRTPEYLGKKIEKHEMKWVVISILTPGVLILIGSGISAVTPAGLSSLGNSGPHGLTEILYAFSSAAGNNGSAFAGLNANTPYYNCSLGIVMLLARMAIVIPSLGVAGLLANKKKSPHTLGTFSTDSALFFILLICVILLVGALTFFPALALGPFVEQLLMLKGQSF